MIINHLEGWAYIGINKNGSTSLHDYLQQLPFWGINPEPANQHRTELPAGCESFRILIVVRNPFSRALSLWQHARLNEFPGIGFADFLHACQLCDDPFYRYTQVDYLRQLPAAADAQIVKLEEIEDGLRRFFHVAQVPPVPRLNVTDSHEYRAVYRPAMVDLVRQIYREAFDRFNYPLNP